MKISQESKELITMCFNAALYEMQLEEVEYGEKLKMDNDYILLANVFLEGILKKDIKDIQESYMKLIRGLENRRCI